MKKRIMTDFLPTFHEGSLTVIGDRLYGSAPKSRSRPGFFFGGQAFIIPGLMLLAALIWPASALAQSATPPPVHSFGLEQGSNTAEADDDELILIDLFDIPDETAPSGSSPMPSLPPNVTPVASTPPAASSTPMESGPPAGPPLVNLPPPISTPTESRSLSAPLDPPTVIPTETSPPIQVQAPAVAAPPVQAQTPPETVPSVQVPAGYTPLPTVPLQSVSEPLPDPFALPPVVEPETGVPSLAAPADSRTVPLGRTQSVPAPQWEATDPGTTPSQSQVISGAPLPQFDASQSNWIQLEIGQGDGSGQTPLPARRPTSVYSLSDPNAKPLPPPPAEATVEAAADQALDQAISQPPAANGRGITSPGGREQLRNLFHDILPPEGQDVRALTANQPAVGGQAPAVEAAPKVGPLPKTGPAGSGSSQIPKTADDEVGSSAILKAGGLLTVDEQFGAAEILPPLSGRPRWPVAETQAPAKTAPVPASTAASAKPEPPAVKSEPAKTTPKPAAKPAPAKASGSGSGQAKKGGSKKPGGGTPATPAGVGLIIINETGRDRVGQQYRSVLNQMGYKVVSVGEGKSGRGVAGQTVISYRPGLKAKAQAVARHLPGKKVLVEAKKGQVLASEIMIYIR